MARGTPLRLTLIGRFALWRGSQEIGVVASGQRLIGLLALRDRPVGRMHVAGTLWPDYPTERSLADLRTTLWRVNQSGEQLVVATPSLLSLDAGHPAGADRYPDDRLVFGHHGPVPPTGGQAGADEAERLLDIDVLRAPQRVVVVGRVVVTEPRRASWGHSLAHVGAPAS